MTKVMNRSEESGTLVAFTAMAPLAVGGLVGLLVARGFQPEPGIDQAAILVLAVGVLALVISVFHLGRPWRAPLALLRLASSWLSREVILFGLFLFFLGAYAILPILHLSGSVLYLIGLIGALIGLAGTVATGETYRLHARPSWDQGLTIVSFPLGALSTGLMFGFFAAYQFAEIEVPGYAWVIAAVLLVASLAVTMTRSISLHPESAEARLSRQLVLGTYLWLLVVRVVAATAALVLIGIGGGAQYLAWVPALLGEFADRTLFFKTVVPVTLRGRYL
jgi:anaerobic dimethyl sulfoxide reductase subunit C (anchor subunit)